MKQPFEIKALLEKKVDGAFISHIMSGDCEQVEQCLEYNDPNIEFVEHLNTITYWRRPLYYAETPEMICLLLDAGAKPNTYIYYQSDSEPQKRKKPLLQMWIENFALNETTYARIDTLIHYKPYTMESAIVNTVLKNMLLELSSKEIEKLPPLKRKIIISLIRASTDLRADSLFVTTMRDTVSPFDVALQLECTEILKLMVSYNFPLVQSITISPEDLLENDILAYNFFKPIYNQSIDKQYVLAFQQWSALQNLVEQLARPEYVNYTLNHYFLRLIPLGPFIDYVHCIRQNKALEPKIAVFERIYAILKARDFIKDQYWRCSDTYPPISFVDAAENQLKRFFNEREEGYAWLLAKTHYDNYKPNNTGLIQGIKKWYDSKLVQPIHFFFITEAERKKETENEIVSLIQNSLSM